MTHRTRFERKETIRLSINLNILFRRLSSFYTAFLELRQVLFKSMTSPDEVTTFQRTNCLGWSSCFATSAEWCPLLRNSYTVHFPQRLRFNLILEWKLALNLQSPQLFPVVCKIAAVKDGGRFPQMSLVHILDFSVKDVRWTFSFDKDHIHILVVTLKV